MTASNNPLSTAAQVHQQLATIATTPIAVHTATKVMDGCRIVFPEGMTKAAKLQYFPGSKEKGDDKRWVCSSGMEVGIIHPRLPSGNFCRLNGYDSYNVSDNDVLFCGIGDQLFAVKVDSFHLRNGAQLVTKKIAPREKTITTINADDGSVVRLTTSPSTTLALADTCASLPQMMPESKSNFLIKLFDRQGGAAIGIFSVEQKAKSYEIKLMAKVPCTSTAIFGITQQGEVDILETNGDIQRLDLGYQKFIQKHKVYTDGRNTRITLFQTVSGLPSDLAKLTDSYLQPRWPKTLVRQ